MEGESFQNDGSPASKGNSTKSSVPSNESTKPKRKVQQSNSQRDSSDDVGSQNQVASENGQTPASYEQNGCPYAVSQSNGNITNSYHFHSNSISNINQGTNYNRSGLRNQIDTVCGTSPSCMTCTCSLPIECVVPRNTHQVREPDKVSAIDIDEGTVNGYSEVSTEECDDVDVRENGMYIDNEDVEESQRVVENGICSGLLEEENGDDMENYYNDNIEDEDEILVNKADALDNETDELFIVLPDGDGVLIPSEQTTCDKTSGNSSDCSDSLQEEGFFEDVPQGRPEASNSQLNSSFDDQGDFIEADIPKHQYSYASSSSDSRNSTTSSYEDLPTIMADCSCHSCDVDDNSAGCSRPLCSRQRTAGDRATGSSCAAFSHGWPGRVVSKSDCNVQNFSTEDSMRLRACCCGSSHQAEKTPTSSSDSSYQTTSSSFQSLPLSDAGVYCSCTPDSNSMVSPSDDPTDNMMDTGEQCLHAHRSQSEGANTKSTASGACASNDDNVFCDTMALCSFTHGSSTGHRLRSGNRCGSERQDGGRQWTHPHERNQLGGATPMVLSAMQGPSCQSDGCSLDGTLQPDANIDCTSDEGRAEGGELFNVSRQTSTSNFDQDENSFQDGEEEGEMCPGCGRVIGDDGSHSSTCCWSWRGGRTRDREDSQTNGTRIRRSQSAPGDARPTSLAAMCEVHGIPLARRMHNTLPGRFHGGEANPSVMGAHLGNESAAAAFSIFMDYIVPQRKVSSAEEDSSENVEKVMIWREYDAYVMQVTQIGPSACGPTAIINILKALQFRVSTEAVCHVITANRRANDEPIPQYLLSRSVAGTTAHQLIAGVQRLTGDAVYARFFHCFPQRELELHNFLAHWMKKGAVALLTLNKQIGVAVGDDIPDAWHHQMVYGVGPRGIYLTNPQETLPESLVEKQLCSESALLVRRADIVSRWTDDCPLPLIASQPDPRWQQWNVLGQLVNVLREERVPTQHTCRPQLTQHVRIPAWYQSGITLFVLTDSPLAAELEACPELPLKQDPSH